MYFTRCILKPFLLCFLDVFLMTSHFNTSSMVYCKCQITWNWEVVSSSHWIYFI